jgi:hypothetical protein
MVDISKLLASTVSNDNQRKSNWAAYLSALLRKARTALVGVAMVVSFETALVLEVVWAMEKEGENRFGGVKS